MISIILGKYSPSTKRKTSANQEYYAQQNYSLYITEGEIKSPK
jgi:hypothetical protein